MRVLVTGGLGYIGSHTILQLLSSGYQAEILDSLSNSKMECLYRLEKIAGTKIPFHQIDIRDRLSLRELLNSTKFDAVMHFAALKAVGESVADPLSYYDNNVSGSITLFQEMERAEIFRCVFSSSATVYGDPATVPIRENFPTAPTSPYGRTKLFIEEIGRDLCTKDKRWHFINLRYFNPVGAHPSGLIGEDPRGIPNNLSPFITQVAMGRLKEVSIFGNDWPTPDGTGVRDFIHILDLARGHVAALKYMESNSGEFTVNLGTGRGYSVLEMIQEFRKVSGREIPSRVGPRRPGDIAACYADPSRAHTHLAWRAELGLEEMCRDAWNWQSKNPSGFES